MTFGEISKFSYLCTLMATRAMKPKASLKSLKVKVFLMASRPPSTIDHDPEVKSGASWEERAASSSLMGAILLHNGGEVVKLRRKSVFRAAFELAVSRGMAKMPMEALLSLLRAK